MSCVTRRLCVCAAELCNGSFPSNEAGYFVPWKRARNDTELREKVAVEVAV